MKTKISKKLLKALEGHLNEGQAKAAIVLLDSMHAADIAELAEQLSDDQAMVLLRELPKELFADVLTHFQEDDRSSILESFTGKEIAEYVVSEMDTDDAADVIGELPDEKKQEVLSNLVDTELARDLADLLKYPDGTAGALMATELIQVNENWTVLKCVAEMRRQAEDIGVVHAVYVVDDNEVLKGSLSLKKLLTTSTKSPIVDLYSKDIHKVTVHDEEDVVARTMTKYDLFVMPVVDDMGQLLGRITLDDIVDVLQEEADSNYQLMSGLSEEVEYHDSLFEMTRARLPWLLVGLIGGIVASGVISSNEAEMGLWPQLIFFIPLIAAMGGNVGVQSSAIVVQAIANDSIQRNLGERLRRELGIGLINGAICSLAIFLYAWGTGLDIMFATTVGSSLMAVILFASLFGTAVPWILNYYDIDPALATGPFITTTNDVLGLTIYFAIAQALL